MNFLAQLTELIVVRLMNFFFLRQYLTVNEALGNEYSMCNHVKQLSYNKQVITFEDRQQIGFPDSNTARARTHTYKSNAFDMVNGIA